MSMPDQSDPEHAHLGAGDPASPEIRPVVAAPASTRGPWVFGGILLVGGLVLFNALEARRAAITAPATFAPQTVNGVSAASPPKLVIPPQPVQPNGWGNPDGSASAPGAEGPAVVRTATPAPSGPASPARVARSTPSGQPPSFGNPATLTPPASDANTWPGHQSDNPAVPGPPAALARAGNVPGTATSQTAGKDRVSATRFENSSTSIPKGTVIQAVLESALDSTRGGFARAIVSRDVWSFDGSRILIQRGSRIIGEYKSDVSLGQKRILVQWQRLTRPDGVIIELDSPSADTLGRAGLEGSVDTHFLQRFAGAILQSSLDIGVQLATRTASRNDTYVLTLPGSTNQATQTLQPEKIPPTVKVKQGSSVSVFVARDLDFTEVSG